ncbi:M23 family metallopeptidase [Pseudarthrobacter sp. ATCC 49987]|uniref:M23 family metallopeptidase n=1 Tax=Pseudarthrobacter sp. ATCC 49987 TaxID=2698204 RepID=UPI001368FA48|nr:M23 family metallopeptidase [Pseudarthrobacter sp. ATCC 49987]
MRPVTVEHVVSQYFAQMATQGIVGNINAPTDTPEYWVGRYGNYQPFGHAGMDFKCPIGTRVYAMADGVVLYAGWGYNLPGTGPVRKWLLYANFPGIVTVIQHPGWIGVYAHLSDNDMAPAGTRVKMGQLIALSGNTGGVDPHLHVEALVDLSYRTGGGLIYGRTDPIKYFTAGGLTAQGTITPASEEDEVLSIEDKEWIGNKLYEVSQDPVVIEKQRQGVINNTTLVNIQAAVVPPILRAAGEHAQALFDSIVAMPGQDGDALKPLFDEHLKKLASIRYELKPVEEGK